MKKRQRLFMFITLLVATGLVLYFIPRGPLNPSIDSRRVQAHRLAIVALQFSTNGRELFSASQEDVKIWNANTLQVKKQWTAFASIETFPPKHPYFRIGCAAASRDLDTFVLGVGPWVVVWRSGGTSPHLKLKHPDRHVCSVALSHDAVLVASAGMETISLRNAEDGDLVTRFRPNKACESLAFFPNEDYVVSGDAAGHVVFWPLKKGAKRFDLKPDVGMVRALAFSPDGAFLVIGGSEGYVRVFDVQENELFQKVRSCDNDSIYSVAFLPHSHLFTCGGGAYRPRVQLWEIRGSAPRKVFEIDMSRKHSLGALRLSFSSDGEFLASGAFKGGIGIWSHKNGWTNCAEKSSQADGLRTDQ